jgi:hypothetical protein
MKMRSFFLTCLCALAPMLVASTTDVPAVIASSVNGAANLWVAADAAIDTQGNLRADTVGEATMLTLRDYRATQDRQRQVRAESVTSSAVGDDALCGGAFLNLPAVEQYRPSNSFDDLMRESTDIVAGRVLAIREGFFRGVPASLLRVNITQVYRDSGTINLVDRTVFVAYPYATLRIGEQTYCTRPNGSTVHPAVGDRVLLFDYLPGEGVSHSVIELDTKRQLVIEHQGRLALPTSMRDVEGMATFEAVEHKVALASGPRKRSPGGSNER